MAYTIIPDEYAEIGLKLWKKHCIDNYNTSIETDLLLIMHGQCSPKELVHGKMSVLIKDFKFSEMEKLIFDLYECYLRFNQSQSPSPSYWKSCKNKNLLKSFLIFNNNTLYSISKTIEYFYFFMTDLLSELQRKRCQF
jgi:hypothetical protein